MHKPHVKFRMIGIGSVGKNASRRPEMWFPVITVDRRYRYTARFGCVDKFTFPQIYADMAAVVGWFEKNKIANAHILKCHWPALFHLPNSGAWKIDAENISVHRLDKTRAIDTVAIGPSQAVFGAQPTAVFIPEHFFDVWIVRKGGILFLYTGISIDSDGMLRCWCFILTVFLDPRRWLGRDMRGLNRDILVLGTGQYKEHHDRADEKQARGGLKSAACSDICHARPDARNFARRRWPGFTNW